MANSSFSEIGKIEAISRLYEASSFSQTSCTAFSLKTSGTVRTASRLFQEGLDFDLTYFPLKHLGHKCVTGTVGELYASLARPKALNTVIGVSSKFGFDHIMELWKGMAAAAREYGITEVALDLVPSINGLTLSLCAAGETAEIFEKGRGEAKSMDLICVSGSFGAAFLGQQLLEKEKKAFSQGASSHPELEKNKMIVGSYLHPELDASFIDAMEEKEMVPLYGYFANKGLSEAVMRLIKDSGLGAKIYADKVPFEGNSFDVGKALDIDPISAAMNGGDDNRLLFVIPISKAEEFRKDFQTFDIVGHLARKDVGGVLVTPDGVELPLKAQGWE